MGDTMTRRRPRTPTVPALRVVLAGGSDTFRQGLQVLLQAGGVDVVASVREPGELKDAVGSLAPDLAIVDACLSPGARDSGVQAALALKGERPDVGVIVVASHPEPQDMQRLVDGAEGGMGYLLSDTVEDVLGLLDALRRVASGGLALSPEVVQPMMLERGQAAPLSRLSARDHEVLSLVAQGQSNSGIASALLLSAKTTDSHVTGLLQELGVQHDGTENGRARATLSLLRSR
jgi:DNA-binding NarL/FixJ family response regulator